MQEKRKAPRRFSQDVAQRNITPLNLPAHDCANVGPPIDEGTDCAAIRIVLADSQTIYRAGVQKIFELENDIGVIAQADTLAGLHHAIRRLAPGSRRAETGSSLSSVRPGCWNAPVAYRDRRGFNLPDTLFASQMDIGDRCWRVVKTAFSDDFDDLRLNHLDGVVHILFYWLAFALVE
jgi:hypothetical protein